MNMTTQLPVQLVKPNIIGYILFFISYIIIHILLYQQYTKLLLLLEKDKNNIELQSKVKLFKLLSTWCPAIFVVLFVIFSIL
jgi:hypothetical protein